MTDKSILGTETNGTPIYESTSPATVKPGHPFKPECIVKNNYYDGETLSYRAPGPLVDGNQITAYLNKNDLAVDPSTKKALGELQSMEQAVKANPKLMDALPALRDPCGTSIPVSRVGSKSNVASARNQAGNMRPT